MKFLFVKSGRGIHYAASIGNKSLTLALVRTPPYCRDLGHIDVTMALSIASFYEKWNVAKMLNDGVPLDSPGICNTLHCAALHGRCDIPETLTAATTSLF
ncbi:unnamed protein product [Clonostachys rhizophaga]|uniref:Uncharacterized protein n=1 Tax=Clonostachys rhizophaga TaxID=160324 RepID=A0A9N9YUI8_9HYPO|nr:unnamed protein product [Clonostachys rhizophaga]